MFSNTLRKMNSLLLYFIFLGGDMATTRRYLDMTCRDSSIFVNSDTEIISININCRDPLGRSALLIGFSLLIQ